MIPTSNLAVSFVAAVTACGEPVSHALQFLAEEGGGAVAYGRLSEWRRGVRPIPPRYQRVMLRYAIYSVLLSAGVLAEGVDSDDATWEPIIAALSPVCPSACLSRSNS